MNKRGLSPVVATVLVILITIVAASIIAPFVIRFVNNNLEESGDCFDLIGDLEFAQTEFNCHNTTYTGFSVKVKDESIVGLKVSMTSTGSSDVFEIRNGTTSGDIKMLKDPMIAFNTDLLMPDKGGVRTYIANGQYDNAELSAILENGNVCGESDSITFSNCTGDNAIRLIGN